VHAHQQHLAEQIDFLRWSGHGYDSGAEHEAKRLSVPIRTLVHDTRMSTSLLKQMGVKDQLGWVDRGPPEPPPGVQVIGFGLCVIRHRFDTGVSAYEPSIRNAAPDRLHAPVSFTDWWERPILSDQQDHKFSRRDLVLAVANKDGGAHIDAELDERYRALSLENSLGMTQEPDRPIANSVVLASVRQIAEELLQTLDGITWSGDEPMVNDRICPLPLHDAPSNPSSDPCPCGSGQPRQDCYGRREPLNAMSELKPGELSAPPHSDPLMHNPKPEPPSIVLDSLILVPVEE
jgi:hypothetical protein